MMILSIDERDARVRMLEVMAKSQAAEARPEHHHMGQLALHEGTFVLRAPNSKRTKVESASRNIFPRRRISTIGRHMFQEISEAVINQIRIKRILEEHAALPADPLQMDAITCER